MTDCGFWVVAALPRCTSGLPWILWVRIGKSPRIRWTSNAETTSVDMGQPRSQDVFEVMANRRNLYAVENVAGKGPDQHRARVRDTQSPRSKVKHRVIVKLTDRGA